ncbi:ATP-binding protein [Dehalococcoidia bacterium]|nr:ATP-binding protein [Dehalococcoidia bacterium]
MRFALEKSAEHLEKGLKLEQDGDLKGARYNLLKAGEFLFKAAEKSEPSLKAKRIERAESILKRAEAIGQMLAGRSTSRVVPQAESAESAPEWMIVEKPNLRLSDVAGLEEVKEQIRIRMIYPFTHPEQARRFGIKKGGGILLYGPPGTGKTMLARAVAGEIDAAFFTVKPSEIMSKWVGEAEQNIARLFSEARKHERAVIFIDEVESLIPRRRDSHSTVMQRVVPQILSEMEGFASGTEGEKALLFMGATNEPWALDEAVLRPGRFDERVYVPLPNFDARLEILHFHLKDKPLSPDISLEEIAQMLEGYSGADIRRIGEKACDIPFVESVRTGEERDVQRQDLLSVMQQVKPSVSAKALEKFQRFCFGR